MSFKLFELKQTKATNNIITNDTIKGTNCMLNLNGDLKKYTINKTDIPIIPIDCIASNANNRVEKANKKRKDTIKKLIEMIFCINNNDFCRNKFK